MVLCADCGSVLCVWFERAYTWNEELADPGSPWPAIGQASSEHEVPPFKGYLSQERLWPIGLRSIKERIASCWLCAQLWHLLRLKPVRVGDPLGSEDSGMDHLSSIQSDRVHAAMRLESNSLPFMTDPVKIRLRIELIRCPASLVLPLTAWGPANEVERRFTSSEYPRRWRFNQIKDKYGNRVFRSEPCISRRSDFQHMTDMIFGNTLSPVESSNYKESVPMRQRILHIEDWLKECNMSHDYRSARETRAEAFVPTRLLYIPDHTTVRLVETSTLRPVKTSYVPGFVDLQYATLSHCWGRETFQTLTSAIYDKHRRESRDASGFELNSVAGGKNPLTKTFQDAVDLCRALSIKYIWIDSWCIIQDDLADWSREAQQMHLVYGSSYLNIAAAASSESSGALYPLAIPLWQCLEINLPGRKKVIWDTETCNPEVHKLSYEKMPLFNRGWVYQELALAPRTLILTDIQMFWKCRSAFMRERPSGLSREPFSDDWKYTANYLFAHLDQPEQINVAWKKLAFDYSTTKVTRPSDRVVALAGLITRFNDAYSRCEVSTAPFVGAWTHNLSDWLMWTREDPTRVQMSDDTTDERRFSHLPSWSWLSCTEPIRFIESSWERFHACITIDSSASLGESDLLSSGIEANRMIMQRAMLRATAPMFLFRLQRDEDTSVESGFYVSGGECRHRYGGEEDDNHRHGTFSLWSRDDRHVHLKFGCPWSHGRTGKPIIKFDVRLDYDLPWVQGEVECVLLGSFKTDVQQVSYTAMLVSMLKPEQDGDLATYERLGIVNIGFSHCEDGEGRMRSQWPELQAMFRSAEENMKEFWLR